MHIGALIGRIGSELTDDLFQQIVQGHQAVYISVLVHHQPDPLALALKVTQLRIERRAQRHEVRFTGVFQQPVLIELPVLQRLQSLA